MIVIMIYDCRAYNRLVKETGPEKRLPGLPYSQRQLFWMASANVWSVLFSLILHLCKFLELH
jgi:hypothetical protein